MLLKKRISIAYFLNLIKWEIIFIVLFSIVVGYLHLKPVLLGLSVPISIIAIIATLVTILLTFRTAQSYDRWWEARSIWGGIVNDSRTLARLIIHFLPESEHEQKKMFVERQIFWVYGLGEYLRRLTPSIQVSNYLEKHNVIAQNYPNALLDQHAIQISVLFKSGKLSPFQEMQLNEVVARLCDHMGKCERIKNTTFPQSYSLLIHVLIYVFIILLPFGLDHNEFFIESVLCVVVPIMFIIIEKTAILMQDPFENRPVDTPMTSIAQTIEINLKQSLGEEDLPVKPASNTYYEM